VGGIVINWVVTIVLGVVLSIVANLCTPSVKNFFAKTSRSRADGRVRQLKDELLVAELLGQDLTRYTLQLMMDIVFMVLFTLIALTSFVFGSTDSSALGRGGWLYFVGLFALIRAISTGLTAITQTRHVLYFDIYAKKTRATIEKLKRSVPSDSSVVKD
jgi:hypothetical protein